MNVLHVIGSMDPATGGPCQAIRNIVPALVLQGGYNEVVCVDAPSAKYLREKQDPFIINALGPAKTPWAYSGQLYQWLVGNLPRFNKVVVHGLWLYQGYAVYKAVKYLQNNKQQAPGWFVMPHGMLDPYFQKAGGRKLKALRNIIYWQLVERKIVNGANGLLFTCGEEMNLAARPFKPYHPVNNAVVGLGIATPPVFAPAMQDAFTKRCASLAGRPYLLFLSRVHVKKGVDMLIEAYEQLAEIPAANPQLPCLVIAGPGLDEAYAKALMEKVAATPHLENRVFFTGMLQGDAKWGAFYGADAFILPSHQENFGIAVAEAMACGRPVLISNKVNIWREIEAAGAGLVCEDTPAGTRQALESWLGLTDEKRLLMGQNAARYYADNFAAGSAARKLLQALTAN